MMIIGCDFHPSWQQVSWLDTETGETGERKLVQASGDAERFYRQVAAPALIGMEATGNSHWLVDLLSELGHELWVGDAAQIRASYVRQQKTDQRDAAHLLKRVAGLGLELSSDEARQLARRMLKLFYGWTDLDVPGHDRSYWEQKAMFDKLRAVKKRSMEEVEQTMQAEMKSNRSKEH